MHMIELHRSPRCMTRVEILTIREEENLCICITVENFLLMSKSMRQCKARRKIWDGNHVRKVNHPSK